MSAYELATLAWHAREAQRDFCRFRTADYRRAAERAEQALDAAVELVLAGREERNEPTPPGGTGCA